MFDTQRFTLVGVLHLLPLPAAPVASPGFQAVCDRALADAEALVRGGVRVAILENLGDAPFRADAVDPHVPAMLAVLGARIRATFGEALTLGYNVLRNDGRSALAAAAAGHGAFVRVNVLSGATWADQGLIQGRAHDLLRYRRELGCAPDQGHPVRVFADVLVKHGVPAGERDVRELARDTAHRGGADGLIVTGARTGAPTDPERVAAVVEAAPGVPVWIGSGATPASLPGLARVAHGAIVGTWLHRDGALEAPLDADRVARVVGALG